MRTGGVPLAALLLVLASTVLQVSSSGDYFFLEGEEDASNEYLEVKRDDLPIFDKLRQSNSSNVFEMFGSTEKQAEDATENILTDDSAGFGKDDDSDNFGSGLPEKVEPEPREKTLRVTFSVFEPYIPAYSNRDSQEFLNISRSLANAVDLLFDSLPGTQRSSLVRIQSLVNDDFWCKVTLDIVTSGYENMINIKDILRNHIKNNGRLGNTSVKDDDFSANVIDPVSECAENELQCDEYVCLPMSIKCDGHADCRDGTDEFNCPEPNLVGEAARNSNNYNKDYESTSDMSVNNKDNDDNDDNSNDFGIGDEDDDNNTIYVPDVVLNPSSSEQSDLTTTEDNVISRGDQGETDVLPTEPWDDNHEYTDAEIDEITAWPEDLTTKRNYITDPSETDCDDDYMRCDASRCVELSKRCDGFNDCVDATDEADCPAECGADDFRCNDNRCIESSRRCNSVSDCPDQEDELGCDCRPDEFRCQSDGSCIEERKRCDNVTHCADGSDEQNCAFSCPPGSFTCSSGFHVACAEKCNGVAECDNGEDEDDCEECAHRCDGVCISTSQFCNRIKDCSDGSDEKDCNFCDRLDDFRCESGECLSYSLVCNGIAECSDESDEQDCDSKVTTTPEQPCSYEQFQCTSDHVCIDQRFFCDGQKDCLDGSDEDNCRCPRDSWQCRNGECVPTSQYCDTVVDCQDGSDESDCPVITAQPPFFVNRPTAPPYRGQTGPVALNLKLYPENQTVRDVKAGGDVVFQCRDEGPLRAAVRWQKYGGIIKAGSTDVRGRLEMFQVTQADSGEYICQADAYQNYPGSQVRVSLIVDDAPITFRPPFSACQPHEATCGNGQCIPKSAVCNNNYDCTDRSDEENCHQDGRCEPNQFKCNNRKCVLKTWICDSEDDCGDGSDEENCGPKEDGSCLPVEYTCRSQKQCIPRSYHCDGQTDCLDGTDEIGCSPIHITRPPKPSTVNLNPGDTLTLRCEAVGVPMPLISWRLNWNHVPEKCTWTSDAGIGILTCPNMQAEDRGAYSCEAINNKGTTFAAPDAIVFVNKTDPCPKGYFNNEARSESECIRCFCFGKSSQCRSADLFTYNMPTPLGEGGTRLLGIKQAPTGDITIDTQPITNQYYYQSLRNGATVTKFGDYSSWSNSHPFLTLPESYNGNQLKSYGGHIKYTLSPQTQNYRYDNNAPTIIIKGKYGNLFHFNRMGGARDINIEARLTPEDWQKSSPSGYTPASREDIMMTLDEIEMILLRADLNNAGVNITEFAMESADHINVDLGAASLVEECTCPKEYEGLSCQKCANGFVRKKVGPWLGDCLPEECPPGTYGDPSSGLPCKQCPCPLTSRENQFARTCSLGPEGSVICDCFTGYEGNHCQKCAPGYEGNPMIIGDSCRHKVSNNCNPTGTKMIRPPDECVCKDNVQGRYCDQCKNDSFYLSSDFRHGCALCFCSGVSQQCMSSNLRRKTVNVQFNVPQIVDQVKIYNSSPAGPLGAVRYTAPVETDLRPQLNRGDISLNDIDHTRSTVYYWSLPASFAGDKVTSYGGYLRYTLKNVPSSSDPRYRNTAADVQLISDNRLTFHYFGDFAATHEGILNTSVQFLEKGWQRPDGKEVSRAHFLLALADVKTILIKATYSPNAQLASPVSASIEIAEADAYGPTAFHVEQCVCPPGYIGTSCEDCAPGFTRSSSGLYLEHCGACECNGKSTMCNPETGVCYDCADNTDGDQCELCKPGYDRDPYGNCVEQRTSTIQPCRCDPRGTTRPCDETGNCYCKQNVEGDYCDRCRPGSFGLDAANPDGCHSCYCSGVTNDCHEGNHYTRVPMAAPVLGENYGGFAITDLNAERVIKDDFVPMFEQSELMYTISFRPDVELYWSLPILPGNRVLSYGGNLSLRQKFSSNIYSQSERGNDVILDGGDISIYWTNPNTFPSGVSYSYQVPLKEDGWYILNTAIPATRSKFMSVLRNLKRVLVRATVVPDLYNTIIADVSMDTATQNYDAVLPAAKGIEICMCPPGYTGTSCETCGSGYYKDNSGYCQQCSCNGHDCQLDSRGQVVCNCQPPFTGYDCSTRGGDSSVTEPPPRPSPPESTVVVKITSPTIKIQEVGSSVNFTCQALSRNSRIRLPVAWSKSGGTLPLDRTQVDQKFGILLITNLQVSDSGKYICETSDGINTAQAYATLKVPGNEMTLPTVEISPSVKEYYEGDRIELECRVRGNPTPSIRWQRASNRPLPLTAENIDTFFIIERARIEDSGEYRCIASNTVGSVDRTAVITVRQRPSYTPRERLTVSVPAPTVNEGQSIRVACTGTTNMPAGSIDWVRQDNAIFLPNVRSENGVLYIDYAETGNQGVYICQAPITDVAPVPILVTVVALNPEGEESNVTVSVDRLKIPTGGSGKVDCNPVGHPTPLIKWRKHDGSLGPDSSQRSNSLIINNAQESDQGYYLCEGSVDNTPVASIYVFVEIERRVPPQVVILPPGETAVQLGSQFQLLCKVLAGDPEPDVTWNRNGGRPLSKYTQLQPQNVLQFTNIEVNDEGEYTCTARNDAGSASASAVLKVRLPPEITVTPDKYIEVNTGDAFVVECRANGYPEPMVSIEMNDFGEVVSPSPGYAALRVQSASARDGGYYTCTATSVAGTRKEPFAVVIIRGDGGDDGDIDYDSGVGSIDPGLGTVSPEQTPSNVVTFEGRPETVLECPQKTNKVRWSRNDRQPLQQNAFQDRNRLIILNASKSDSGEYVCSIYNENEDITRAVYVNLEVIPAPRITLRPPTQTVLPGQSPTVECIVDGEEIIDITWRPLNRMPSNRVDTRTSTLVFQRIQVEDAGRYECIARSRLANASAIAEVIVSGPREPNPESQRLVVIDQPRLPFRVGDNVDVRCRALAKDIKLQWLRLGTNQYVASMVYGGGVMLSLQGVAYADAGVYRCIGNDTYGRTFYDDFDLKVLSGSGETSYPDQRDVRISEYNARLGENVDLPCTHNLEPPVSITWRREFSPLPAEIGSNQPNLHLESVTEADAGIYVCRISNSRANIEAKAILTITGVVPKFDGDSYLSLPTLKDAFKQFEIEISIKPTDANGLILYNSENQGRNGDYIALQLTDGVPEFIMDPGNEPLIVKGDRPLQLNTWHTIRLSRVKSKVTMDVDNTGPFIAESSEIWAVLELKQPLFIGGVPDNDQLPVKLAGASGFIGCASMLILGREEKNIMMDSRERYRVSECNSCAPNLCLNNGVCQEARNERGYMCICATGFAGLNCDRASKGEACRPGLCGPGKCSDTNEGYKCACPVTNTGRNCEVKQSIEYPAFTGSAYVAIKPPEPTRTLKMSMKIKAAAPVTDGIIMYCAESSRGYGGFTSLTVHDGRLEFRYDVGGGSQPVVLVSNRTLPANDWTTVHVARVGPVVSLKINSVYSFEQKLTSPKVDLNLDTPIFVGGVDESYKLNNNTGVTGGFNGCIKDFVLHGVAIDIVNSTIRSENVQECNNYDRGDIPEMESVCQCRNGGACTTDSTTCSCPPGYAGLYCEHRVPSSMLSSRQPPSDPCALHPCRNGGTCRLDLTSRMNHTCDCPLGYSGVYCQMPLELLHSVGFNGNGYLELPAGLLNYEHLDTDPAIIAMAIHTTQDGVLLYQKEGQSSPEYGDYILLKIERGFIELEWDLGSGKSSLRVNIFVNDGDRHQVIAKLLDDGRVTLSVDSQQVTGTSNGISTTMNADTNIYIGGIPDYLNQQAYLGFTGCIEQLELMNSNRGLLLGSVAVAGRNTQRCKAPSQGY